MATDRITATEVLTAPEIDKLEACLGSRRGIDALPGLAPILVSEFGCAFEFDADIVRGFASDSSNLPGRAQALARPRNTRECAAILRACFLADIPITLSGGRSNLTGSATPEGGVVLSTCALGGDPPRLDFERRSAHAPVGMILEEFRKQVVGLSDGRFEFPVDPTSRADAVVGGALACNASGFTPGEAGAMRNWVGGLDFLLPDGRRICARRGQYISSAGRFILVDGTGGGKVWPVPRYQRPPIKNAGGPFSAADGVMDFVDLVVGSEGIFGMIAACDLQLAPRPSDYLDLFFSLPSERRALDFLDYIRGRLGDGLGRLAALEYFGINCKTYMDHADRLFRGGDQVGIYVRIPLHGEAVESAAEQWLATIVDSDCAVGDDNIIMLDNERDRAAFFEARHSLPAKSLEVVQRRGTFTIMTDTVVPADRFAEFLDFTHSTLAVEGLEYLAFGHFGDCHLHFMILPQKEQVDRGVAAYDAIVAKSAALGGVYSGEHGTGKRKRKDFIRCYTESAVEEIRRCKAAIDPGFILNRGNVIEYMPGVPRS